MTFYNNISEQIKAGDGITFTTDVNTGILVISVTGGGTVGVLSVHGTTDQITVNGTVAPIISIATTYAGQTSIETLGTIKTGTWLAGDVTTPTLGIKSNNNTIQFIAPSTLSSSFRYTLPPLLGKANQILTPLDNDGTLGWKDYSLSKLTDCNISSVNPNQLLVYNNSWTPYTLSGTGFSFDNTSKTITLALSGLTVDTSINLNTLTRKQVLSFDTKWKNTTLSLKDGYLSDVSIASASPNQILQYNGTTWTNNNDLTLSGALLFKRSESTNFLSIQMPINLPTSATYILPSNIGSLKQVLGVSTVSSNSNALSWITPALADLSDVNTTGVTNCQLLVYKNNNNLNKWIPYAFNGASFDDTARTITIAAVGGVDTVIGKAHQIVIEGTPDAPVVTIDPTYEGQTSIKTLGTISTGAWNATPITVAYGGTGLSTGSAYSLLCGGATNNGNLQFITTGTANQVLISGGANAVPHWSTVTINNSDISGINNLSCSKLYLQNGNNTISLIAPTLSVSSTYTLPATPGTTGQVLTALDNSGALVWSTPTVSGGGGTVTLLPVINGGTGLSSINAYSLIAGGTSSTGALQTISTGSSKQLLTAGTASSLPSWATISFSDGYLSDVKLTSTITGGQVLTYSAASNAWVNMDAPTGSSSSSWITMNSSSVSAFDTSTLNTNSKGFWGGVFDGRYIYFSPNTLSLSVYSGQVTRYDTTLPFNSDVSYSFYDTTQVNINSKRFQGGAFDGRYVYLIAYNSGQITRYDTTLPFGNKDSYAVYDTTQVHGNSTGFQSIIFDGKYVYLVPYSNGQITRYDTTQPFGIKDSYAVYDTTIKNSNSKGFLGAVFDNRYIYFIPYFATSISGQVTRYDTTLPFNSDSSYSFYDTSLANSDSKGFRGGVFDGRYIYFVPIVWLVTRYDTTLPFDDKNSYSFYDTSATATNTTGYNGGVFDGRYVYFVPQGNKVLRYDTTLPFASKDSYSSFDTTTFGTKVAGFRGGVYDGKNVYLFPYYSSITQTYSGNVVRILANQSLNTNISTKKPDISLRYNIQDALISQPSNNQTLTYNSTINKWGNTSLSFNGGYLSDVKLTSTITGGQVLTYNAASNAWVNMDPPTGDSSSSALIMDSSTVTPFDITTVTSNSKGLLGGVFDSKYIYFVHYGFGQITRYDTTLPFSSKSSYTDYDTTLVHVNSRGFSGSVFDGRYIYFVPSYYDSTTLSGQVTRYDSRLPFASKDSYAVYDTTQVHTNSKGFGGGVFDGKYIYFVPRYRDINAVIYSGQITRYDTTLPFDNKDSYTAYDTTQAKLTSKGFTGGVFDGKYVYFVPGYVGSYALSGQVTRYDTTLPFDVSTSYSFYDMTQVNTSCNSFSGAVFDGRYIYFVPTYNLITRYDTTLPFDNKSSYDIFNVTNVVSTMYFFVSGVYDGRYVYFTPVSNNNNVLRYDTTLPFASQNSYSSFNLTTLGTNNSSGFMGSVFDGKYVYLSPNVYLTKSSSLIRILANKSLGIKVYLRYDVQDALISNPSSNQVLAYNNNINKWFNTSLSFSGAYLSDVSINTSTLTTNQVLQYDGSKWVNSTISTPTGSIIDGKHGGTGIDNEGRTITLGGNISTDAAHTLYGAYASTFTFTNITNVTFPTSGTLATTSQIPSLPVDINHGGTGRSEAAPNALICGGSDSVSPHQSLPPGSNKQLLTAGNSSSPPSWVTVSLDGGYLSDVSINTSTLTANQVLQYDGSKWFNSTLNTPTGSVIDGKHGGTGVNNDGRTITLGGNLAIDAAHTLYGGYASTFVFTNITNVTFPTSGTLATTSQIPSLPVDINHGGTGRTEAAPNALICGGSDSVSPHQSLPLGSNKQLLTAGNSSTPPSWVTVSLNGGYLSDVSISSPEQNQCLAYNGAQWVNSPQGILSISNILFINASSFSGSPPSYTLSPGYDAIIIDIINMNSPTFRLNIPTLSGNGTQSFYLQILGSESYWPPAIYCGENDIYIDPQIGGKGINVSLNSTYLFTYYASSGNPWAWSAATYPNYTAQKMSSNVFPLKNNINLYLFTTNNYHAIAANMSLPSSLVNGQTFMVKDVSGYMNTTQITLNGSNGNAINGATTQLLSTSGLYHQYVYIGTGTNGNCIILY